MFLFIVMLWITGNVAEYLNTSHVLIYPYILGYMLIRSWNLNTSHVLIYQSEHLYYLYILLFKYISCSYLSDSATLCQYTGLTFKYISCSYLSLICSRTSLIFSNLNTSHVLIYQRRWTTWTKKDTDLNTSHVLIYLTQDLWDIREEWFKYISCSYLSESLPCVEVRRKEI